MPGRSGSGNHIKELMDTDNIVVILWGSGVGEARRRYREDKGDVTTPNIEQNSTKYICINNKKD